MKIEQNDIDSVEPFGIMDGKPVNLVKTRGGLNMATVVDAKGNNTVLAAASHQAILCYTVEQRYPSFQPMIMKSEADLKLSAESHSHFLSDDLRKSGHDIYSVQNGKNVDFFITKLNIKVGSVNGSLQDNSLVINKMDVPSQFANGISSAVSEKALCIGINKVKVK